MTNSQSPPPPPHRTRYGPRIAHACALIAILLFLPAKAQNARLPYAQLYAVEKAQADLNRTYTNLAIALTLQSTLPGIETSNLSIYIDAKAGKIPIELGPGGSFVLPLNGDLLTENPWINVNQPKGTMKLNWKIGVVLGRLALSVRYARLMQPVRDSQIVQEQMLHFFPGSPKVTMAGLRLTFPSARQKAIAIVRTKSGDRTLEANDAGEIILPLDPDLMEENPEITFSDLPGVVEIVSHKSSE